MAENPLSPGPIQKPSTGKNPTKDNRTPYQKALEEQKKAKNNKKEIPGDSIRNPAKSRDGLGPGKFYVNQETGDIMQIVGPGFYDSVVLRADQATSATGQENALESLENKLSQAKVAYEPFDPIKRPSSLKEPENVPFEGKLTSKKALKAIIDSLEKQIKKISSAVNPLEDKATALREEVAQDDEYKKVDAPGERLSPAERDEKLKQASDLEAQASEIKKTGDTTKKTPASTTTTTTAPQTTTTTTAPPATTTTTTTVPTKAVSTPSGAMNPSARNKIGVGTTPTVTSPAVTTTAQNPSARNMVGAGGGGGTGAGGNVGATTVGTGKDGKKKKKGKGAAAADVLAGLDLETLKRDYPGYAWVWDLAPEFNDTKKLWADLLNGSITADRFNNLIGQSSWYTDQRTINETRRIKNRYGDILDGGTLSKLVNESIVFQYKDDELDSAFFTSALSRNVMTGEFVDSRAANAALASNVANIYRNYAKSMFLSTDDTEIEALLTGKMTEEDFNRTKRQVAQATYKNWADLLNDPAMTMDKIVKPWKDMAASVLELDPTQIDMTKPQFSVAYAGTPDGKMGAMSLGDWYVKLRSDATYGWDKTNQAKQEAQELGYNIAKAFGKA